MSPMGGARYAYWSFRVSNTVLLDHSLIRLYLVILDNDPIPIVEPVPDLSLANLHNPLHLPDFLVLAY